MEHKTHKFNSHAALETKFVSTLPVGVGVGLAGHASLPIAHFHLDMSLRAERTQTENKTETGSLELNNKAH